MKAIIVGNGEIGKALYKLFSNYHDIEIHDPFIKPAHKADGPTDILLISFPYSLDFVDCIKDYKKTFKTEFIIIFSTVSIGTTEKIKGAVHTPIEGKHPDLLQSLKCWDWIMGGYSKKAIDFFAQAGITPKIYKDSRWTEFLKLQSTTLYGVNIEWSRYVGEVAKKINMPYAYVKNYNQAYNQLYENLNMPEIKRYVLQAPMGKIGGHCILSNAKILNQQFPNSMIKYVLETNEMDI